MVVAMVQSNSVSFPILLRQSAAKTDPKSLFLHLKARISLHFLVNRAFGRHVTSRAQRSLWPEARFTSQRTTFAGGSVFGHLGPVDVSADSC